MIKLTFATGGALRRVFIDGRKVSLMAAELGNAPLQINLDKLDEPEIQTRIKKVKLKMEELKKLAILNTEEELAEDIKTDFQRTGWRLFKRE